MPSDEKISELSTVATPSIVDTFAIPRGAENFKMNPMQVMGFSGWMYLNSNVAVGATSITVKSLMTGAAVDLGWIVIDPFTSECEIKEVTNISGNRLTISALIYAHAEEDPVFWVTETVANVKWFGATGDGVTDETTAIRRAFTRTPEGFAVYIPTGTYIVEGLIGGGGVFTVVILQKNNTRIFGDGKGSILQVVSANATNFIRTPDTELIENTKIHDLSFINNAVHDFAGSSAIVMPNFENAEIHSCYFESNLTGAFVSVNAAPDLSQNCHFHHNHVYGGAGTIAAVGAKVVSCRGFWVNHNLFDGVARPFDLEIDGETFREGSFIDNRVINGRVATGSITNSYVGAHLLGQTTGIIQDVTITDNKFIDNYNNTASAGYEIEVEHTGTGEISNVVIMGNISRNFRTDATARIMSIGRAGGATADITEIHVSNNILKDPADANAIGIFINDAMNCLIGPNIIVGTNFVSYITEISSVQLDNVFVANMTQGVTIDIATSRSVMIDTRPNEVRMGNVGLLRLGAAVGFGGGANVVTHLSNNASLNFPNIIAGATAELTIAVVGALTTDTAIATPADVPEAGLIWSCAAGVDIVTIRILNTTGGAINPAARAWRADIWRH